MKRRYRIIKNENDLFIIERLVFGLFWIGLWYDDKLNISNKFSPVNYSSEEKAEKAIVKFLIKSLIRSDNIKREIIKEITF